MLDYDCSNSFLFQWYIQRKGSDEPNEEEDLIAQGYPETFVKLDKFFADLCTKFGSQNIFDSMNTKRILDIFMLCTR